MAGNDKDEKKDEGIQEYIDKVILNPHLEQELQMTGGTFTIPNTPKPGEEKEEDQKKK